MIASDAELSDTELLDRVANRMDGLVTVPKFEQFADDLYRGNIRSGDVPLCVDPPRRKHADRR
jgi:hypothetical protein